MKNAIFLIIISFLFFSCKQGRNSELKGNVESIKESEYRADEKFGEPIREELDHVLVYDYDEHNNKVKEIAYDNDGDESYHAEYTYNKKNEIVFLERIYTKDFMMNVLAKDTTYYYSNLIKTTEEWISRELLITKDITDDGVVTDTTKIDLDKNGNPFKHTHRNSHGSTSVTLFTYTKKGDLTEKKWLGYGEDVEQWERHEYDKNRLLVKTNILYSRGSASNDSIIYEYKLDDKSNWIERVKKENGKVSQITEREITYRK
ncbi:MAG: hypothetical protein Q4G63_10075 [Bacteroidia bacterium]|nr:hypothetical protein [Bacteroidia bacterium]